LTSATYVADLNEVKEIGSVNSTTRTAEQTHVAQLWAGGGTPTNFLFVCNNVARTVATTRELTTVEKARLFALTNFALHDALQTTFASKFYYGLWRPVTAIHRKVALFAEGSDEGFSTQSSLDRIYWISQDLQDGRNPVNPIVTRDTAAIAER
jgi:hypothetical protein